MISCGRLVNLDADYKPIVDSVSVEESRNNVGEADEFSKITMTPPPKVIETETDSKVESEIETDSNKLDFYSAENKKKKSPRE